MNKPLEDISEHRKQACERMLARRFSEDPESELEVIREYFYYGDIQKYIANSSRVTDFIVFEATPFILLEDYLENLKIYWEWVLEDPHNRGSLSLRDKSVSWRLFEQLIYYSQSICLPDKLKRELFFLAYGSYYDPERLFPMPLGPDKWQPKIDLDIDWLCCRLMNCIRNYLMGYNGKDKENPNGQYYIDYFLSLYPYMSRKCFSLTRCTDRFYEEEGKQINLRGYQIKNRWFIAGLNNILTDYEEEGEIEQLTIHDADAFAYLKQGLEKLDMPDEFYELEKFVLKQQEDCLYATE